MSSSAPFLTVYSCKFGNRFQDALFGPPLNLVILRAPLVVFFAWLFLAAIWALFYYVWPISSWFNSYDGFTKSALKTFYTALIVYFILNFIVILSTHSGGCREAISAVAIDTQLSQWYYGLLKQLETA